MRRRRIGTRDGREGALRATGRGFAGRSSMIEKTWRWSSSLRPRWRDTIALEQRLSGQHDISGISIDAYLLLLCLARGLDPVATLDDIRLQADRTRRAVELEEQTTGIAQDGADLVPPPQRCRRGGTVLTYGL